MLNFFQRDKKDNGIDVSKRIEHFKSSLFKAVPFYGDIIAGVNIIENNRIDTAATDGVVIYYNKYFFQSMSESQCNYVLLHELFHMLMLHWKRMDGKDKQIWNIAADYVVNGFIESQMGHLCYWGFKIERPSCGCFLSMYRGESVEELYNKIWEDNIDNIGSGYILVRNTYAFDTDKLERLEIDVNDILDTLTDEQTVIAEQRINDAILSAKKKWYKGRSQYGLYPFSIMRRANCKRIRWDRILKDYLVSDVVDVTSYDTPERKYLHMELILPGATKDDLCIPEIWAFVDSSGSIEEDELSEFVNQLHRIATKYECNMNMAFWSTDVTNVYTKINKPSEIFKCEIGTTGGTDIECVYDYLDSNQINPTVLLILTDGYFDNIDVARTKKYRNKTVLILTDRSDDELKYIGKITRI